MSSSRDATMLSREITLGRGVQSSQVDQMTSPCLCWWLAGLLERAIPTYGMIELSQITLNSPAFLNLQTPPFVIADGWILVVLWEFSVAVIYPADRVYFRYNYVLTNYRSTVSTLGYFLDKTLCLPLWRPLAHTLVVVAELCKNMRKEKGIQRAIKDDLSESTKIVRNKASQAPLSWKAMLSHVRQRRSRRRGKPGAKAREEHARDVWKEETKRQRRGEILWYFLSLKR